MTRMLFFVASTLVAMCIVAACVSGPADDGAVIVDQSVAATGDGHAAYDAGLQAIMAELQRETDRHWPQAMDDEHAPMAGGAGSVAFDKAVPLARALARAAERIPGSVAHLKMLEADRRAFAAQAETLREQAVELSIVARKRDRDATQRSLDAINQTCRSCHARFLDVSGPLTRT